VGAARYERKLCAAYVVSLPHQRGRKSWTKLELDDRTRERERFVKFDVKKRVNRHQPSCAAPSLFPHTAPTVVLLLLLPGVPPASATERMFYSQLLLAKKGTLGKVWLAAHYDKRLTKQQISNSNIKSLVVSVAKPSAPLSLRVSAHLLLGLSRIFQRQVMYLFVESNEALVKIRAVSSPFDAAAPFPP